MTEEQNPTPGADDELVTPEEHAEASEGVDPGQDVADPDVPADVEIASRGADMDDPSDVFTKVYVLGSNPYQGSRNPYTEGNGFDHAPNFAATRQYAIDAGCWPTGPARYVSAKKHPDGVSWIVTYEVPVIPAHAAKTSADGGTHPEVVGNAEIEKDDDGAPTGELVDAKPANAEPTPAPDAEKPADD